MEVLIGGLPIPIWSRKLRLAEHLSGTREYKGVYARSIPGLDSDLT
jgi:hypothetical protein